MQKIIFYLRNVFILVCLINSSATDLFGQDTLFVFRKQPLAVKVIEISDGQIRYKKFSNPDGPTYIIKKSSATKIVYQNGSVDLFKENPLVEIVKPDTAIRRHWFKGHITTSLVITDFIFNMVSVNLERTFLSERLAIRIPLSVGLNATGNDVNYSQYSGDYFFNGIRTDGYLNRNKIFSTGMDILVYPFMPGKINYFVGPSVGYGQYHYWTQQYGNAGTSYIFTRHTNEYFGVLVKNGVNFFPVRNFSISINLAMGIYKFNSREYSNAYALYYEGSEFGRAIEGGISLGYRF